MSSYVHLHKTFNLKGLLNAYKLTTPVRAHTQIGRRKRPRAHTATTTEQLMSESSGFQKVWKGAPRAAYSDSVRRRRRRAPPVD